VEERLARPDWPHDREFDGAETGCGEILVDLRRFFLPLAEGCRVLIIARDPGSPLELPAWCRMSGNPLLCSQHPYYLVERKQGGSRHVE
jgi:tRNA 2-thiouridine synthesizing protein A